MLFSSIIFVTGFLPAVILIYYLLLRRSRPAQNVFLLIASLAFYAYGEPWFVLVMIASIIANWAFGLAVARIRERGGSARPVLIASLVFNLAIIFVFKYLTFTIENVGLLLGTRFMLPEILLPIGISFFTFQAISYVVDVYRGTAEVQKNPLYVGLYISFFPQLIAGPIVRYNTVAEQIVGRTETWELFTEGVTRFIIGFCKKILLANNFALVADACFKASADGEPEMTVALAWLGAITYTLQIYFDFSGYSDMAIGLGRMFGFRFTENFRYPYISKSASEFWRRWHISLGSWFRDYVYIPLGGSRVAPDRVMMNLLVVWFLTGLWHGANWTFICWGMLYCVLITAEKVNNFEHSKCPDAVKHIYTLFFVMLGWVLFRAETMGDAITYIQTMFGAGGVPLINAKVTTALAENAFFLFFGVLFSMPVAKNISKALAKRGFGKKPAWAALSTAVLMILFLVSISYLVKGAYNPFIYFNF